MSLPQAAVQLLLLAGQPEAAFAAALQHRALPAFAAGLGDDGPPADYERAAAALEAAGDCAAAAALRGRRGQPLRAVGLYIQVAPGGRGRWTTGRHRARM